MKRDKLIEESGGLIGFIAIVLFVLASMLVYSASLNRVLSEETAERLSVSGTQGAQLVKTKVQQDLLSIKDISSTIGVYYEEYYEQNIILMLKDLAAKKNFKRMGIILANGRTLVSDSEIASPGYDLSGRDWFRNAMKGELCISGLLDDYITSGKIIVYSAPISNKNKGIIGVLFAAINIAEYHDILNINSFYGKGVPYVVTKDGNVIAQLISPDVKHINETIYELANSKNKTEIAYFRAIIDNMRSGKGGFSEFYSLGNKNYMYYAPVGINDWWILSTVPAASVNTKIDLIIFLTDILFAIVVAAFSALLIYNLHTGRRNREKLHTVAYIDELTGKPNIAGFKLAFEALLKQYSAHSFAVMKLDIVKIKNVNSIMGYEMGDNLIKQMGNTFDELLHEGHCSFGRITADEFIILYGIEGGVSAVDKCDKFIAELRGEFDKNLSSIHNNRVELRIGRYFIQKDENDFHNIFEKVNFAHRIAKTQVTNIVYDYNDDVAKKFVREIELANKFNKALGRDEFKLFIQPKYRIEDEKIVGGEALSRWIVDGKNISLPVEFIPVFEKNGTVCELDFHILDETCRMLSDLISRDVQPVSVSVNFSRLHIMGNREGFIKKLLSTVDKYSIPHELIEIEITENAVVENEKSLLEFLNDIHKWGFSLAMDDFGTGYSSLSSLKNMPFDSLKLDRSFFADAVDNERTYAVIEAISDMTRKLRMRSVVEGVEYKEQIDMLKKIGYEVVQGYYFAKPMPYTDFMELLITQSLGDSKRIFFGN